MRAPRTIITAALTTVLAASTLLAGATTAQAVTTPPGAATTAIEAGRIVAVAPTPITRTVLLANLPAVEHQGATSACSAYAIAHVLGTYYLRQAGHANITVDPLPTYAQTLARETEEETARGLNAAGLFNKNSGVLLSSAWDTARDIGLYSVQHRIKPATWHALPAADRVPVAQLADPTWLRTIHNDYTPAGLPQAIRDSIDSGNPVVLNVHTRSRFESFSTQVRSFKPATATLYRWNGSDDTSFGEYVSTGYHAVTVVGYTPKGAIIQNSWGDMWGDGGYAVLDWTYIDKQAVEALAGNGLAR